MPDISGLLGLINAATGSGGTTVDSAALRALLTTLAIETALLATALTIAILVLAQARRKNRTRLLPASETDSAATCGKIRQQLDEMIRKTNERNNYINSIFSSIEDGFMLVDSGNRVVLYNPRAQALLGIGPGVFFGTPLEDGKYSAEVAAILDVCQRVTRTKKAEQLQIATPPGMILDARIVSVASKYRNSGNLGSLAIVKDVTEIRKMESLKKDFVATVSHEFRTPLTLISGFMEMFKTQDNIEPADRKRAFEIVEIETERLKRLVSELLTLSEIENALPGHAADTIDVEDTIDKIAASLGPFAEEKRQTLDVRVNLGRGMLRGNADWFYQAVRNLVENAIKYTPEGGAIGILASYEGQSLTISVSDTGIGIAESELEKIFERFYRVEKSRGSGSGGSGLGLALVRDIVSIFGGSVDVKSEVAKGSTFTLRFPTEKSIGSEE